MEQQDKPSKLKDYIEAAKFLSGLQAPVLDFNEALNIGDGSIQTVALVLFGLPDTKENQEALDGVLHLGIHPPTPELDDSKYQSFLVDVPKVSPKVAEALNTANEIQKSYEQGLVQDIVLSGKHSAGTKIVEDVDDGHSWLLKPNAGKTSEAAGIDESNASMCAREACFYACSKVFGLSLYLPQTDLIDVGGIEYAAIEMFPKDFQTLEKWREINPNAVEYALEGYRKDGTLFKWACLYFILGEIDGHFNNSLMNNSNEIKLIDHGSSFAGFSFEPGEDPKSFVPFFLRYLVPHGFSKLAQSEKLAKMPLADLEVDLEIVKWLGMIQPYVLESVVKGYGIVPTPMVDRLKMLQRVKGPNFSRYINLCWLSV